MPQLDGVHGVHAAGGAAERSRLAAGWSAVRPLRALSRKQNVARGFTPSWFTVVMSTGIVAQLIATFPYDAPAKNEVGWAFWWLTLVLFCIFAAVFACRFLLWRHEALLLFDVPVQAAFLGAIPPSLSVIVNGFPLFLAPRWDYDRVLDAAVALFWVNAALSLACTTLLPFYFFKTRSDPLSSMTAVWLLPVIPAIVSAGSGGQLAKVVSPGAADPIVGMSYILWGVGVPLSFSIMTIYYRRLSMHNLPPAELVVSSFLPLGPMGMGASALLNLGAAMLRLHPPPSVPAAVLQAGSNLEDGAALKQAYSSYVAAVALAAGDITALITWGFGLFWLAVAVCSVATTWRRMRFHLGWWGFVFPTGVFANAANLLWRQLPGLGAMRVVAAVLIACVILLWCVCMAYTLVFSWRGTLFDTPCLRLAKTHQEAAAAAAAALDAADEPLSVCWSGTAHGGATMRQLAAAQQQQRQPKQQERNSDGSNKPSLDATELDP